MKIELALASIVVSLLMAGPAMSQPRAEQQAACEDDAYRLCPNEVPDEARVRSCLTQHKASLSPACRAQFKAAPHRRRVR